jgi:sulfoxide reductase heme-binding subunit YedZ
VPSLWLTVRATGTVDLMLLTLSVALGVSVIGTGSVGRTPRFVIRHLHRDSSLLAVVLLIAHVGAAVALLHLTAAASLVPFASHARRVYLGLGVLGADLMLVILVSSVLRMRLGLQRWRLVHVLAYVSWTAAVMHGAAPGTDVRVPWVADLDIFCVAVVVTAAVARLLQLQRHQPVRLLVGGAAAALVLTGFISWVHSGPAPAAATTLSVPTSTEY